MMMPDYKKFLENLKKRGFQTSYFETGREAADYLNSQIDGTTVGFGGSVTSKELGLYESLGRHNKVFWHWQGDSLEDAEKAEVYLSSANGAAESGELLSIDGNGNRVKGTLVHERVYFILGKNKIQPDLERALWRARNVAAPKNGVRFDGHYRVPCAVKGDKCYDCSVPDRMCRVLMVLWGKPNLVKEMEVVVVNEDLGF